MKILKVIHGYPMLYNAGSEVYTQTICHELAKQGHTVHVFTREEDSFRPDGSVRSMSDPAMNEITLHLVNNPRMRDRYRMDIIDQRFAELIAHIKPDVVHIGHLNHLSTSLVFEAKQRNIPVVFTLHDYWLMCPRGQFMQMHSANNELWAACDGQSDRKCATQCYARYFSGNEQEYEQDVDYWENWVRRRMDHIREVVKQVDLFISPAKYLKARYEKDFGLPAEKSIYLDYGFDRSRMDGRVRPKTSQFTFGYIGTHIPAKGIHQLIDAFGMLNGKARLRIWGRDRGQDSRALRQLANRLQNDESKNIEWMKEYENQKLTQDVFNKVDVIVVPSIWVENSPLVIHEAQQARIPVITANTGGMAEYVRHEVNGLSYQHRSSADLATQMQRLLDDPLLARRLGEKGYLFSNDGNIPDIEQHVRELETCYTRVITS